VHVHATEFDRCASDNINQEVYEIERNGLHAADQIITVSNFTKSQVVEHYGIEPSKIEVVHNAVEMRDYGEEAYPSFTKTDKIVLFLGRITIQKGPEHFLWTAKRVLEKMPDVKFVVAGSGDMERYMIDQAAHMGISKSMMFTGFLRGPDIDAAYKMADVYIMPSISEPFGITPLEAMMHGTPTIISKQSGVSEVVSHCLKVDFWDIDEMANKILAILNYQGLSDTMKENGYHEVKKFDWRIPARKVAEVYNSLLGRKR
jgi:glycogen(starch) synthase